MRIAVIVNPAKVRHGARFRKVLEAELAARGLPPPHHLLTTIDDPGAGQARQALDDGATRILVAGGDGTVRMVLGALQGTRTPVGLLPAGTGNVLARNLRIPLRLRPAVRLALDGVPRPLDLLRYEVLDENGATGIRGFGTVMAGLGADAAVVADTHDRLKGWGWAGYAAAALRHIRTRPVETRVAVDGAVVVGNASLVAVGNVGELLRGLRLFPRATGADGELSVLVAAPRHLGDVLTMMAGVVFRARRMPLVSRMSGRDVAVHCAKPTLCQVDGDLLGSVTAIRFEVLPGAATVVIQK
ncbi:MAG: diacylglycerol kinase family protein [Propionibacteriaceae bacterium]|nr:diacylglycerol kinase family protein [Propionibacteriaceae bacterium]